MTNDTDDLLGDAGDDLLGAKPAKKASKPKAGSKAPAKVAKAPAKAAKPAADTKAPKAAAKAPAAPAKPAKAKSAAEAVERNGRGGGKFYFEQSEKEALAKEIGRTKKPATTKELAEKHEVETWKIRRAIVEVLVANGSGTAEKVGNSLTYTPAGK